MKFIIKHNSKAPKFVLSRRCSPINIGIAALAVLYMTSCSNQQSPQVSKKVEHTPSEVVSAQTISGAQLIEQAKRLPKEQVLSQLVTAARQLQNEQNYYQAIWLAHQLAQWPLTEAEQYQLAVIKAQGFLALSLTDLASESIKAMEVLESSARISPSLDAALVKQELYQLKQQRVRALNAQLHAFALDPNASKAQILSIWQQLAKLSNWQIEQLALLNPPQFDGWQQLLSFCHLYGHEQTALVKHLQGWQQAYPLHPGNEIAQQLTAPTASFFTPQLKNIAVILPLSGKQAVAGQVAQEGILAAYSNNDAITLHFIDSSNWQIDSLAATFAELSIDYVIGPLLKENVEAYIARDDLSTPTLLLNTVNGTPLKAQHVAFSMRPDSEAIQAATTLSAKKFKHPLVLSHNDSLSQRVAEQFVATWQKLNDQAPALVYFDEGNDMEKVLKESLAVDQSQARINELDSRIKQVLKSEPRSRRDIDMIYLIGSTSETKLLKPYIDVNISPFADQIPIYASSRSHSAQFDESDSRDLVDLVFTEMPWLLPSEQQNRTLVNLSKQLWPQRSDSLQRIFAMGFDSFNLLTKLDAMKAAPYIRHYGQTGILQVNQNNVLTRSLLWGKYNKDGVNSIAMVEK